MWNPIISGRRKFWRSTLEKKGIESKNEKEESITNIASEALEILSRAKEDAEYISSERNSPNYLEKIKDDLLLIDDIEESLSHLVESLRKQWNQHSLLTPKNPGELASIENHLTQVENELKTIQNLDEDLKNQLLTTKKEETVWYKLQQLKNLPEEILNGPIDAFIKYSKIDGKWIDPLMETGLRMGTDFITMLGEGCVGNQHYENKLEQYLNRCQSELKFSTGKIIQAHKNDCDTFPNKMIWTQNMVSRYGNKAGIKNLTIEEINQLGLGTVNELVDIVERTREGEHVLDQPWPIFLINYLSNQKDRLEEVRLCTVENVQGILSDQPSPAHTKPWIEKLCKFYDIRPYVVRTALKEMTLRDDLILELLRARPLAFYPFPEKHCQLLQQYTYKDFNHIVSQAPHLYLLFPEKQRNLAFETFRKNPDDVPPALASLVGYPLLWEHLFPKLDETLYDKFISKNIIIQRLNSRTFFDEEFFKRYPKDENELKMVKSYFRLGTDQYKLWIDPVFHHLGPEVFDLGLHGGHKEPDYLEGMLMGAIYLLGVQITSEESDWELDVLGWDVTLAGLHRLVGKEGPVATHALGNISKILQGRPITLVGLSSMCIHRFLEKSQEEKKTNY